VKCKVVVLTGGTSGIGHVAAERLAAMGARMVLVARNRERGAAAMERLRRAGPAVEHAIHYADLSRVAEMKRVAHAIAEAEPRIDVLINNAGAIHYQRDVTEDGFERTFATNHLAYFVLTEILRDRLAAAPAARVVSTASEAHRGGTLNFDDLQAERRYKAFPVYCASKLANILFTRELARRLAGTGVTANCLHPGFVATRFGSEGRGVFASAFRAAKLFAISPEKGAATIIHLASSGDVADVTGEYFFESRPKKPSDAARDDRAAARLWAESARLFGLALRQGASQIR
jgi:NAD(P)-dependent dehydrogenase (short-subunit alcohol dehydrogenase family)